MDTNITLQTKQMIDNLKAVCANKGLGNASSEYKIITEVFLYKFLNRLAVMMIDRYWSPVQLFMNNPEPTVVVTAEDVFLTPFKHDFVRDDSMPVPSITPPKIIAQRIR